jgi:hypothetical protein
LKKIYYKQATYLGTSAGGGQNKFTLFNCLRAVLDDVYKWSYHSSMGSPMQLTRASDFSGPYGSEWTTRGDNHRESSRWQKRTIGDAINRSSRYLITRGDDYRGSSRGLHNTPSGCDCERGIDETEYFSRLSSEMLIVLRGLDYITVRNQIQLTEQTLTELLGCPAAPTLLITHRKDLRN